MYGLQSSASSCVRSLEHASFAIDIHFFVCVHPGHSSDTVLCTFTQSAQTI